MKLVFVIFVTLFLVGCGGMSSQAPTPPSSAFSADPVLTRISLSPATASIHVGEEQAYLAQALDQYNHPMTGVTFDWTSSDDGANGNAIALFHGGVATGVSSGLMHITASASGVTSAPAALTVLAPPPALVSILVTPSQPSVLAGGTQQFSAVGKDQYGNEMSGISFTWSTANPGTATVTAAGLATGAAPGTTAINASAQGVLGNGSLLTVLKPASLLTSMVATPAAASVQAGNTVQFTVVGFDQFDTPMAGITFSWTSSDPTIASVNALNGEGQR